MLCGSSQLWKTYIDLEIGWGALDRARNLYERLLEKTQHVKVFKSYADFEWRVAEDAAKARKVSIAWQDETGLTNASWLDGMSEFLHRFVLSCQRTAMRQRWCVDRKGFDSECTQ